MTQVSESSSFFPSSSPTATASGTRDITATLHATRTEPEPKSSERFNELQGNWSEEPDDDNRDGNFDSNQDSTRPKSRRPGLLGPSTPNPVIILTAVCCVMALMLPVHVTGEEPSVIPSYLHLSVPQKLIAAYALGLVTMVIFKT